MTIPIIEGAYVRDLLDQPAAIDRTVERLNIDADLAALAVRLRAGEFRRVVLTGMGSSLFALYPLHLALTTAGVTSLWVDNSELVYYQRALLRPDSLVVAVSQSGRSAETVRLIDVNAGRAPVVGVTNTIGSPLATRANAMLLTHAGEESTVSCKTYVATLAALEVLAALLTHGDVQAVLDDLSQAGNTVAAYLDRWREHATEAAELTREARCLFYAGRGPSLAAALTGGLITKESTHFPTEGMTTAAFRHGPMEMLGPHTRVVVFGGDEATRTLNAGIVDEIRRRGHPAELVSDAPAGPPLLTLPTTTRPVTPIVEILPVQMITLGLAAQLGIEAGRFTLATKVTATE